MRGRQSINRVGMRFGRLIVLAVVKKIIKSRTHYLYEVLCDCGKTKYVARNQIGKRISSCGCKQVEEVSVKGDAHRAYTHGHTSSVKSPEKAKILKSNPRTTTYASWDNMLMRAEKSGVSVDKAWRKFSGFLQDMGEKPPHTRFARIDKDNDFFKENCQYVPINKRWSH